MRIVKHKNALPVTLIGLAWALFGLGYQSLVIGYVPTGLAVAAELVGLFLAGAITGALLISVLDSMDNSIGRILIMMGYLMFAPLGMMVGLVAPGSFEPLSGGSWLTFTLLAPILMVLAACAAVGVGMGLTGGLAFAARRMNQRA